MTSVVTKLETTQEQRELFLWKFGDVSRDEVNILMKEFLAKDVKKIGEIDEHACLFIMEQKGYTMTVTELRELVKDMDADKNKLISFIELCCGVFKKDINELNNFVDEEARARALQEAMRASMTKRQAEEEIQRAKEKTERDAGIRAAALERESKLTGVAGAAAFFSRRIEGSQDAAKSNEQMIKEEAARRRVLRQAEQALKEAQVEVNKRKSAEEIAKEVKEREARTAAEEAAILKKQQDDEKAFRAARKATLNAIWNPKK